MSSIQGMSSSSFTKASMSRGPGAAFGPDGRLYTGPPTIPCEEIKLISRLGAGQFGEVWKGNLRGIDVAVKVPHPKRGFSQRQLDSFKDEVAVMSQIFHPHVALFMGACTESPETLRIVTELLEGDVEAKILDKKFDLSLYRRLMMARDAASGMAWLHGSNPVVLHRDLKLSNLLVTKDFRVKVGDFGMSTLFPRGEKIADDDIPRGTPLYMAPEQLDGDEFNEKADIYSFGILLHEMVTREKAFGSFKGEISDFITLVCDQGQRPPIPIDLVTQPRLAALIKRCWDADPAVRPLFPEILTELDYILVEVAINDPNGMRFWQQHYLKESVVKMSDLLPKLYAFMGLPLPDDPEPSSPTANTDVLNMRCLITLLDDPARGCTVQRFGDILSWFGPLEAPAPAGDNILERMRDTLSAKLTGDINCWFWGDLAAPLSESKLRLAPAGTFLVRFSSAPPLYTISKVSLVGGRPQVKHIRVEHAPGQGFAIDKIVSSPTLSGLISECVTRLNLQYALQGSRFTMMFQSSWNQLGGYSLANDSY